MPEGGTTESASYWKVQKDKRKRGLSPTLLLLFLVVFSLSCLGGLLAEFAQRGTKGKARERPTFTTVRTTDTYTLSPTMQRPHSPSLALLFPISSSSLSWLASSGEEDSLPSLLSP